MSAIESILKVISLYQTVNKRRPSKLIVGELIGHELCENVTMNLTNINTPEAWGIPLEVNKEKDIDYIWVE